MLPRSMIRGRPNPRHRTLGDRLKFAREAVKIKPGPLSTLAGMGVNAVFRIEKEGRVPGVDVIEYLASVLSVSPGWLAYAPSDATPMEPASPIEEGAPLRCAGLGARLRGLREEQGLTRRALGEAAGISGQAVTDIEEGRSLPGVDTLEALAKGLGVSPAWLAYGEGPQVLPRSPRRKV